MNPNLMKVQAARMAMMQKPVMRPSKPAVMQKPVMEDERKKRMAALVSKIRMK